MGPPLAWPLLLILFTQVVSLTQEEKDAVCALSKAIPVLGYIYPPNCTELDSICTNRTAFPNLSCANGRIVRFVTSTTLPPKLFPMLPLIPRGGYLPNEIKGLTELKEMILTDYISGLTGTLPTDIGLFGNLTRLTLENHRFSGSIPSQIWKLPLIQLSIPNCTTLGGEFPSETPALSLLNGLILLDISLTSFSGTLPTYLGSMETLQVIYLFNNRLSGTIPTQIGYLSTVRMMYLQNNSLTGQIPSEIGSLYRLGSCQLSKNDLSGPIPEELWLNNSLSLISLGDNPLTGTLSPNIGRMQSIKTLRIYSTKISGTIPPQIEKLTTLTQLVLSSNRLHGTVPYIKWSRYIPGTPPTRIQPFGDVSNNFLSGYNQTSTTGILFQFNPQQEYCETGVQACRQSQTQMCDDNRTTCVCKPGLEWNSDQTVCLDIDECASGGWQTLPSNNTMKPCSFGYQCINTFGSFYCCPDGYEVTPAGDGCRDINECSASARIKHSCRTQPNTYCVNHPGNYTCDSCRNFPAQERTDKDELFPSLKKYQDIIPAFEYHTCIGRCNAGQKRFSYPPQAASCLQITTTPDGSADLESILCFFACTNLTTRNAAEAAIQTLFTEFQRGSFLYDVIRKIFPGFEISLSTSKKRANQLNLEIRPPCTDNASISVQLNEIIRGLAFEITPNAPALTIETSSDCRITVTSTNPDTSSTDSKSRTTAIIIGVVISVSVILFVLAIVAYYYLYGDNLNLLPDEVAWSYQNYKKNPFKWTFRGGSKAGYHFLELEPGTPIYEKAHNLFSTFSPPQNYPNLIKRIVAVYNPLLVHNFIGAYRVALSRSTKKEFMKQDWSYRETNLGKRQFVIEQYKKRFEQFDWNKDSTCPIIPAIHGTDFMIAEKICENGFAALSSLDAGYFGQGIYFTSYFLYTSPYICRRKSPSIILSWVIPGNIYPVIEDHRAIDSLLGAAIKPGYSSHYVITNKSGEALQAPQNHFYDELVVGQESQITPAFIFEIEIDSIKKIQQEWSKKRDADTL